MMENSSAVVAKPKRRSDKPKKADSGQLKEAAAAEKTESKEIEESKEGSVLTVISRRLRAANKKIKKCEEIEQARAAGKEINGQQVSTPGTAAGCLCGEGRFAAQRGALLAGRVLSCSIILYCIGHWQC